MNTFPVHRIGFHLEIVPGLGQCVKSGSHFRTLPEQEQLLCRRGATCCQCLSQHPRPLLSRSLLGAIVRHILLTLGFNHFLSSKYERHLISEQLLEWMHFSFGLGVPSFSLSCFTFHEQRPQKGWTRKRHTGPWQVGKSSDRC